MFLLSRGIEGYCPGVQQSLIGEQAFGVKNTFYTYNGSEDLLKTLVADRSAVAVGLRFSQADVDAFQALAARWPKFQPKKGLFEEQKI